MWLQLLLLIGVALQCLGRRLKRGGESGAVVHERWVRVDQAS
jgi:hypothetical protein